MADIQEAIVVSGIHTNIIDPIDGKSKNYKEVTTWWDGTPMDNSKVDGTWFRRKGSTYLRQVIDKEGELFLEKDTVAQLRALSPLEILFLRGGVYKGVKLNGYYEKGDTPAPIEYYLSDTAEDDDGGSVFEVGGIKLEHVFVDTVDLAYYGVKEGDDISLLVSRMSYLHKTVRLPKNTYNLNLNGNNTSINLSSNTVIEGNGSTLKLNPTSSGSYAILKIWGVDNVVIKDINIIGDRDEHVGTTGDHGMGIDVRAVNNLILDNVRINKCWGDGLYFGTLSSPRINSGIILNNVYIDEARRNGISFVNAKNVKADNLYISNTNGTNPQMAIDFEPNDDTEYIQNIHIGNLYTENNFNGGIDVQTLAMTSNSPIVSIKVDNWISKGETGYVGYGYRATYVKGSIEIGKLTSINAPSSAVHLRHYYNQPDITFNQIDILSPNRNGSVQFYSTPVAIYSDINDSGDTTLAVHPSINIKQVSILDNHELSAYDVFVQNRVNDNTPINNVNIEVIKSTKPITFTSYGKLRTNKTKSLTNSEVFALNKYNIYDTINNTGATSESFISLNKGYPNQVVKIINTSGAKLTISGVEVSASELISVFTTSTTGAINRRFSSEAVGANITLKCNYNYTSKAIWEIVEYEGVWENSNVKINNTKKFNFLYGDNYRGSIDIDEAGLDNLTRTCFFRASGLNTLGVNIQHNINDAYSFQIRATNYTNPKPLFRVKNNGVWTPWIDISPNATTTQKGLVNQATASADSAEQASGATPTKEEFDALLAELRDLKTKMRAAGILAT